MEPPSQPMTVERENSIYESFDQMQTTARSNKVYETDNDDIYETYTPDRAAQVMTKVNINTENTDVNDTYDRLSLPRGYENTEADDTYDRLNFHGDWDKKQ